MILPTRKREREIRKKDNNKGKNRENTQRNDILLFLKGGCKQESPSHLMGILEKKIQPCIQTEYTALISSETDREMCRGWLINK